MADGIGRIDLVAVFGSDSQIANIARMSKGNFKVDNLETDSDRDRKTISYLVKHDHRSPLYHAMLQFRIKMPLFLRAQWFRHTVGMTRIEKSRRYTNDAPEFYVPTNWSRCQKIAQQFSDGEGQSKDQTATEDPSQCAAFGEALNQGASAYANLLQLGVAPEHARMVLPVSTYTEFVETGSLYAYLNLLKARGAQDAQHDLHPYTEFIWSVIRSLFPMVAAEWEDAH